MCRSTDPSEWYSSMLNGECMNATDLREMLVDVNGLLFFLQFIVLLRNHIHCIEYTHVLQTGNCAGSHGCVQTGIDPRANARRA